MESEEKLESETMGAEGLQERNTSKQSESFELALLMSSMDVCRDGRRRRRVILRAASKVK